MREQAEADLEPYKRTMWHIVQNSLHAYVRDYASLRHRHSLRTQSSIINDLMVAAAQELFAETPGVRYVRRRNAFLVVFESGYVIKLKKLNGRLQASNIPTFAALDFVGQSQLQPSQLRLEGMPPPPTNLHLGYQLSNLALTESKIWVTCPDGTWSAAWSWEITGVGAGAVLPFDTKKEQDKPQEKQKKARKPRFKKREPAESAEPTQQLKSHDSADE